MTLGPRCRSASGKRERRRDEASACLRDAGPISSVHIPREWAVGGPPRRPLDATRRAVGHSWRWANLGTQPGHSAPHTYLVRQRKPRRGGALRERRRPESNRCRRLCRPLRNHSATSPKLRRSLAAGRRPVRDRPTEATTPLVMPTAAVGGDQPDDARARPGSPVALVALEPGSRAISSAGRAPSRQGGGRWFEPSIAH
jgi:hypothetical protein